MDPILGQIILFAGSFAPSGWSTCEGQTLSIAQNQALFSIIGTTYGGDGRQTFQLPDLRGAFPTQCSNINSPHAGGSYAYGEVGGAQSTTITASNMPPHNHTIIKGASTNLTGTIGVTTSINVNNTNTSATEIPAQGNALSAVLDLGGSGGAGIYNTQTPNTALNSATAANVVTNNLNFDPTGLILTPWGSGPLPIGTVPPFVAMQYIIATEGIYPSRP